MSKTTLMSPFDLVASALECPRESLNQQSALADHPQWDSFGHLRIMMALEEHYGIDITDETIRRYETMTAITRAFEERRHKR
jgi:acyl carrier protein